MDLSVKALDTNICLFTVKSSAFQNSFTNSRSQAATFSVESISRYSSVV
jgi:hypothetical protein